MLANLSAVIPEETLGQWILVWSLLAFLAMWVDKLSARMDGERVSERTFFVLSALGGFPGVILGGVAARHKTSKGGFLVPVGLAAVLWTAILVVFFIPGLVRV